MSGAWALQPPARGGKTKRMRSVTTEFLGLLLVLWVSLALNSLILLGGSWFLASNKEALVRAVADADLANFVWQSDNAGYLILLHGVLAGAVLNQLVGIRCYASIADHWLSPVLSARSLLSRKLHTVLETAYLYLVLYGLPTLAASALSGVGPFFGILGCLLLMPPSMCVLGAVGLRSALSPPAWQWGWPGGTLWTIVLVLVNLGWQFLLFCLLSNSDRMWYRDSCANLRAYITPACLIFGLALVMGGILYAVAASLLRGGAAMIDRARGAEGS